MLRDGIDLDALLEYINELDEPTTFERTTHSVEVSTDKEPEHEQDDPTPPTPTFKRTRSSAPTPTPANESANTDDESSGPRENSSETSQSDEEETREFLPGEAQFDNKELEHRLHCLGGQGSESSSSDDSILDNGFDFLEEIQSYFFEDDDYLWNKNRRAFNIHFS